jgi:very-short-patch-repair endonuclease
MGEGGRREAAAGWGLFVANEVACKLLNTMTPQEVKLWVRLREFRALGHHFRRQSPIAGYIVDFECRRSCLVVEVDGNQHGFDDHRRRDEARDRTLSELGYRVLRFGKSRCRPRARCGA